jgi:glucose/arabinose dehydrogenase
MARVRNRRGLVLGLLALVLIVVAALNASTIRQLYQMARGVNLDLGPGGEAAVTAPPGFQTTVYARDLQHPRFMAVGPDGTVYVAEQDGGRVSALPDADHDGRADRQITVADGLDHPSSVVVFEGTLIVGEGSRVSQLTLGADHTASARKVLVPNLPTDGVHTTRTVLVGPDRQLYVAMGSTCNICNEGDERRAAVSVYGLDGRAGRVFARGLRNAVGLAINPWTQDLWATNNGADGLGDDAPPETVYALQDGGDYGWPHCHAGTVVDSDYGGAQGCQNVIQPLAQMQAHMAPLGLAFYQNGPFPAPYNNSLYVAFHGSWNRPAKVGYKVMRVPLREGQVAGAAEDFLTGFLPPGGGTAAGRPVGLAVGTDGSLLVSDDKGGFIYRVVWTGQQ